MVLVPLIADLLFTFILLILLAGCTGQPNYAPVIESNTAASKKIDSLKPSIIKPAQEKTPHVQAVEPTVKDTQVYNDESLGKYYVVGAADTLYSIGIKTGYGFKRLAKWNQVTAPYHVQSGQKLKLFEPHQRAELKKQAVFNLASQKKRPGVRIFDSENAKKWSEKLSNDKIKPQISSTQATARSDKKSIISTDNKKMLKLRFEWPIKGRISKNFLESNKKGIDIAGKMGQKVSASEAGKIVYSGQGLIGFGNLVIIKHNDNYLSAYGNNSRLLVAEGEQVEKGQIIAFVGKALSKKAALHFEIRKHGKPVNPLKLLP
jgi:lipoprotein NlpD